MPDLTERAQVDTPTTVDPAGGRPDPGTRAMKRRQLIKLGASSVPVAFTLASRPVRAWHCNSTSAWGSAQINPTQSTTARNSAQERIDDCWSISEWVNNISHGSLGQPWPRLSCMTTSAINNYSCLTLYSATGGLPTGLSTSDKVMNKLKNGTTFQKYMLVARLNANLVPNVQSCLKSTTDQLVLMAGGSYSPPNLPGVVWDQNQIIQYLGSNYIVTP